MINPEALKNSMKVNPPLLDAGKVNSGITDLTPSGKFKL
jgi:hypothetical protein